MKRAQWHSSRTGKILSAVISFLLMTGGVPAVFAGSPYDSEYRPESTMRTKPYVPEAKPSPQPSLQPVKTSMAAAVKPVAPTPAVVTAAQNKLKTAAAVYKPVPKPVVQSKPIVPAAKPVSQPAAPVQNLKPNTPAASSSNSPAVPSVGPSAPNPAAGPQPATPPAPTTPPASPAANPSPLPISNLNGPQMSLPFKPDVTAARNAATQLKADAEALAVTFQNLLNEVMGKEILMDMAVHSVQALMNAMRVAEPITWPLDYPVIGMTETQLQNFSNTMNGGRGDMVSARTALQNLLSQVQQIAAQANYYIHVADAIALIGYETQAEADAVAAAHLAAVNNLRDWYNSRNQAFNAQYNTFTTEYAATKSAITAFLGDVGSIITQCQGLNRVIGVPGREAVVAAYNQAQFFVAALP